MVLLGALSFHNWLAYDTAAATLITAAARALLPAAPPWAPPLFGLGVLLLLRALPPTNPSALESAEAGALRDVPFPLEHVWTPLTTKGGVEWRIHSVCVRAAPSRGPRLAPLVVLHGHSSGSAHWEVLLRLVAPHTDVWLIDLPGWGRSAAPRELLEAPRGEGSSTRIMQLLVDMLEGWLRARGLFGGAALLGHSMGGHLAASFAAAHPGALSQLLLASPVGLLPMSPGWVSWRATAVFYAAPPQRVVRLCGRVAGFFFAALLRAVYPEDNPRFPPYYFQMAWNTYTTGAADGVFSSLFQWRRGGRALWSRPVLPLLMEGEAAEVPVALLWGTEEEMMSPVFAAQLHRLRRGVSLGGTSRPRPADQAE